jgi:NAD(P)H-dependent FMN reductase
MTSLVGVAGSLRKGSYNMALLRAAAEVVPPRARLAIASIAGLPLFDAELESERGAPEPATTLKDQIAAANGVVLVTPEYNQSIPGVLKNAIDWLSRPAKDIARVFGEKPVAIMGATPGAGGTRMAQAAWLPVLRALGTRLWTGKQLYVGGAAQAFDAAGRLVDEKIRKLLTEFMAGFVHFARPES